MTPISVTDKRVSEDHHHQNYPILLQSLIRLPVTFEHSASSIVDYISSKWVRCFAKCSTMQNKVYYSEVQYIQLGLKFECKIHLCQAVNMYNVQFNAV